MGEEVERYDAPRGFNLREFEGGLGVSIPDPGRPGQFIRVGFHWRGKRVRRAEAFVAEVSSAVEQTPAELLGLLDVEDEAGDERAAFLERAIVSAAETPEAAHRRALVSVVKRGLGGDDAALDAAEEDRRILTELRAVHVRTLLFIQDFEGTVRTEQVAAYLHTDVATAGAIVGRLVNLSLVADIGGSITIDPIVVHGIDWAVTELGERILRELHEAGVEDE